MWEEERSEGEVVKEEMKSEGEEREGGYPPTRDSTAQWSLCPPGPVSA